VNSLFNRDVYRVLELNTGKLDKGNSGGSEWMVMIRCKSGIELEVGIGYVSDYQDCSCSYVVRTTGGRRAKPFVELTKLLDCHLLQ
jgi:hypothetical protein